MIKIITYEKSLKDTWDEFIKNSKNGYFMFQRDFMEYHSDRFTDNSLLFYNDDDKLLAVMPASIKDNVLASHGGLSFGGIISCNKMKQKIMLDVFDSLLKYCKMNNIKKIIYKAIPYIYHKIPAQEDIYALFVNNAKMIKCEVSSSIYIDNKLKLSKGKKCGISKAKKANLLIKESEDYKTFFEIETEALKRHNTKPVHTYKEMMLLKSLFPENIKFYGVYNNKNELIAGTILFITDTLIHTQYIASNSEGQENGAVDFLISNIIFEKSQNFKLFDFGISTENGGKYLNEGLVLQKEMFGARTVMFKTYQIDI